MDNIIFLNKKVPIGKGSFSKVYKIRLKTTKKIYALKKINLKNFTKKEINNLKNEIKIHKSLNHENIIKFYDFIQIYNYVYILIEYCKYGSLFFFINEKNGIPESLSLKIFYSILLAIKYLHNKNILHRDIKPENILIDKNLNFKLCDFGLAKYVNDLKNTFCGTFEYMSPEILSNRFYNQKIDIWALGIFLYELLDGNPPFKYKNLTQLKNNILKKEYFYNKITKNKNIKFWFSLLLEKDDSRRVNINQIFDISFLSNLNKEINNDDIIYLNRFLKIPIKFKSQKNFRIKGNYFINEKIKFKIEKKPKYSISKIRIKKFLTTTNLINNYIKFK